jgi:hypothetical protein
MLPKFVKVFPREYKRVLREQAPGVSGQSAGMAAEVGRG